MPEERLPDDTEDIPAALRQAQSARRALALLSHMRRNDIAGMSLVMQEATRTRQDAIFLAVQLARAVLARWDDTADPDMVERVMMEHLLKAAEVEHGLGSTPGE